MANPHIIRKLKYRFNFYKGSPFKCLRNIILVFIIISILIFSFFHTEKRLFSLAERIAYSDLQNHISKQANLCIAEILEENNVDLNSVISSGNVEKIPALTSDFSELNFLKSEISNRLTSYMAELTCINCKIPSMALISDGIFAGYGFKIPVRLIASGSAYADFTDDFISAGINQTKYRLSIKVTVDMELQTVFSESKSTFTTNIPLTEKIIIGDVPDRILGD